MLLFPRTLFTATLEYPARTDGKVMPGGRDVDHRGGLCKHAVFRSSSLAFLIFIISNMPDLFCLSAVIVRSVGQCAK
jgi:hypothetical protein